MTITCKRPSDGLTKVGHRKRSDARRVARAHGMREYKCPKCGLYHLTSQKETRMEPTEDRPRFTWRLHYPAGAHVDILAFTAQDAVRMAGRGQPEKIENLTEMSRLIDQRVEEAGER